MIYVMRKIWWILLFLILATVPVSQTVAQPTMGPGSIVNGASFRAASDPNGALAPGAIVSAFGVNLASSTLVALTVPLSTNIGGSSLIFSAGGVDYAAPLFFVSAGQINSQVPFNVPTGAGVTAKATFNGQSTPPIAINMTAVSPGIFLAGSSANANGAILHNATFALVSAADPAVAGEFVVIYCTGLGPLSPALASGVPAPSAEPLPRTTIQPLVNVGTTPASVVYSGVAPGFIGLYQVAIQVPNVASGNQQLTIISNGVTSNPVPMPVK